MKKKLTEMASAFKAQRIMKVSSSRTQMEIIRMLFAAKKPLRPSQIIDLLRERGINLESEHRVYYHLMKLTMLGLIHNDKISRDLSFYRITEEGKRLLVSSTSEAPEQMVEELVPRLAKALHKPEEEVRKALLQALDHLE